jgi:hypothetical protein
MFCTCKTSPSTVELKVASHQPHAPEPNAGEFQPARRRRGTRRFIPDSTHKVPEDVWGDEGPVAI